MHIRVMTFNLFCEDEGIYSYQNRIHAVLRDIRAAAPDSFGVQEAIPEWIAALCQGLPGYAFAGVGKDDGNAAGENMAVFFLREKYRLADSGTFWLSQTPSVPSRGWDAAENRTCTWAVLADSATGARYAHINTHLDHVGPVAQTKGAALLRDFMLQFHIPAVCTGDFNFDENCEKYRRMAAPPLADARYAAPDTMTGKTFHHYQQDEAIGGVIDFIFTNSALRPLRYRIMNTRHGTAPFASDHFAVYADLAF